MPFTNLTPRDAYEAGLVATSLAATGTALVDYTTEQAVDALANFSFWTPAVAAGYPTITYSFPVVDNDPNTPDEPADYIGNIRYGTLRTFSVEQAAGARLAIELWDDMIPLNFVDVGTDAGADTRFFNSTILDTAGGAPAGTGRSGDVWIYNYDVNPPSTRDWSVGGFFFGSWLLHEVGHTLGLSHAGSYPGPGYHGMNYVQDNQIYSLMSYKFASDGNATWNASMATPMVNDIAAVQSIYGADMTTRTGDTVYGFNSNVTDRLPYNFDAMLAQEGVIAPMAIWDAGGIDTLDLSKFSADAQIDLAEGGYSNAGGQTMAIGIAYGAVIENAIGGSGHDSVWGNDAANVLTGGRGNDTLRGGAGDDLLVGAGAALSSFAPTAAIDLNPTGITNQYAAVANFNGLSGASGAVKFTIEMLATVTHQPGSEVDFLSYANSQTDNALILSAAKNGTIHLNFRGADANSGLSSSMLTDGQEHRISLTWDGRAAAAGGQFVLYIDGVSVYSGVHANQSASLSAGGTLIFGQEQDSIGGGFNPAQIFPGLISDIRVFNTVRTASDIAANAFTELPNPSGTDGLVANWRPVIGNTGTIPDAHGGTALTLFGAPNSALQGNWDNDLLDGGAGSDTLNGLGGDDTLDGGAGADVLNGGDGNDTYIVDNAADLIQDSSGTDTVRAFVPYLLGAGLENLTLLENVASGVGNDLANVIVGNSTGNPLLRGAGGADTIVGGDGSDRIEGETGNDPFEGVAGNDLLKGGAGDDTILGGGGNDWIDGETGNDPFSGVAGNDSLSGEAGDDTILAGAGNDSLYGGSGTDFLIGELGNDLAYGGSEWDAIDGRQGNDVLLGEGGDDILFGDGYFYLFGYGNDSLYGGLGNDIIMGEAGENSLAGAADALYGEDGNDLLDGGAGDDTIYGGNGNDVIDGDHGNDYVVGGPGSEIMLGSNAVNFGGPTQGSDLFVYQSMLDAGDSIYGFDTRPGDNDGLDLRQLFDNLGYTGFSPRAAGMMRVTQAGADTLVQIDADGASNGENFVTLVTLMGTAAAEITDSFFLFQ